MTPPARLRALLAAPGFVAMPAVWDGITAKLTHGAGFATGFLSGSCVAAARLGGRLKPTFPPRFRLIRALKRIEYVL